MWAVIGVAWMLSAVAVAVVLGACIRCADVRDTAMRRGAAGPADETTMWLLTARGEFVPAPGDRHPTPSR